MDKKQYTNILIDINKIETEIFIKVKNSYYWNIINRNMKSIKKTLEKSFLHHTNIN